MFNNASFLCAEVDMSFSFSRSELASAIRAAWRSTSVKLLVKSILSDFSKALAAAIFVKVISASLR